MYNKVTLMGRICHDLELKTTRNNVPVLSFRIAVDRSYQPKGEERKSDFFNIVAWRNTAEFISKYFGKGRMIIVDGELQTRQYVDNKSNATVTVTEIIVDKANFTGEPKSQTQQPYSPSAQAQQPYSPPMQNQSYTPPAAAYQPPQAQQPYSPPMQNQSYTPPAAAYQPPQAQQPYSPPMQNQSYTPPAAAYQPPQAQQQPSQQSYPEIFPPVDDDYPF